LFRDGEEAAVVRDMACPEANGPLRIGAGFLPRDGSMVGLVDEVAFYDLALSQEEVKRLYHSVKAE
jgi:hypothetical protein